MTHRRLGPVAAVVVAVALTAAACAPDRGGSDASRPQSAPAESVRQTKASAREKVPSALDDMTAKGLPKPLVDPDDIRSGGPPPDGIPPIDEPRFLSPAEATFLTDREPVLAVEVGGVARAYPVQVLIWHEIVNDTVGGVPVAVTYCPLCNSAVAVDRRVEKRVLTFGTSGRLYRSSLVMYDRQTESLWSHFDGQAIAGVLTGTKLKRISVATVAWKDWRRAHPDGKVLSRETGFDRDYGRNPYPGYDDVGTDPFLFDGKVDGRLAAKERVVGIADDADPVAVRLEPLLEDGVIATAVGDVPTVIWALPGTTSALDDVDISGGRDVGATGVFDARHDAMTLSFDRVDDGFVDRQTKSRWNVLGTAVDGPLKGTQLKAIEHVDTFWFAWAAFMPETTVVP